mmetsp:Transcript_43963/g.78526  ORF Transcript_43963/g.78526 Transcript_43963/m.78526 type:complete len:238 (+) Transcript_43963:124-837(+)
MKRATNSMTRLQYKSLARNWEERQGLCVPSRLVQKLCSGKLLSAQPCVLHPPHPAASLLLQCLVKLFAGLLNVRQHVLSDGFPCRAPTCPTPLLIFALQLHILHLQIAELISRKVGNPQAACHLYRLLLISPLYLCTPFQLQLEIKARTFLPTHNANARVALARLYPRHLHFHLAPVRLTLHFAKIARYRVLRPLRQVPLLEGLCRVPERAGAAGRLVQRIRVLRLRRGQFLGRRGY